MRTLDYPEYSTLYARYLGTDKAKALLDCCGDIAGQRILDLCGGGGRASREALVRGAAQVLLIDQALPMVAHLANTPRLSLLVSDVESALATALEGEPFDAIVCQQAINFWFHPELVSHIRRHMRQGGVFVFDTFWQPPEPCPVPKDYDIAGRRYVELTWRCGESMVEHVQICEGLESHTMRFKWISPSEFHSALKPHFVVEDYREGSRSVYRCIAR